MESRWLTIGLVLFIFCYALINYQMVDTITGDPGYKAAQIRDLIHHGGTQLNVVYAGAELDPQGKYFPGQPPIVRIVNDRVYYHFPFQMTYFYLPFYALSGASGMMLVSILCGLGIAFYLLKLGTEFLLSKWQLNLLLLSTLTGFLLINYALVISEHIIAAFLCTVAVYCVFKTRPDKWDYALAGTLCGLAIFARPEAIILFTLLGVFGMTMYGKQNFINASIYALIPFGIVLGLFFLTNYLSFEHVLGLRGLEGVERQADPLSLRLLRIWLYVWAHPDQYSGFFKQTPAFFFLLPAAWFVRQSPMRHRIYRMLLIVLSYIIIVPLVIANPPAPQIGERFLYNIYPLAGFICFYGIIVMPGKRLITVALHIVFWSLCMFTIYNSIDIIKGLATFNRNIDQIVTQLQQKVADQNVIVLRSMDLNFMFHNRKRKDVIYFEASEDDRFLSLMEKLRQVGHREVGVMRMLHRFKRDADYVDYYKTDIYKRKTHADRLLPQDFQYQSISADMGNQWIEYRVIKLRP